MTQAGYSPQAPGKLQRKALSFSPADLIKIEPLSPSHSNFPLVIKPAVKGVDLPTWAELSRSWIQSQLLEHGAILFRDFAVPSVEVFQQTIAAIATEAMEYRYRASPRSQVAERIYTSTDYPADQSIFPHNEHAYSPTFPLKIFFYCQTPAQQGGETPIGSTRQVLARIDPEICDRFITKQILYVRNFGDGFGLPWQTVFQTADPAVVDAYCQQQGVETEWKSGDRLRTRQIGPAIIPHPQTGEAVWFNHATFFHVSTLSEAIRTPLLANFADLDLPTQTFYGDGTAIEPDVIEHLRSAYQQAMIAFPWQPGDIVLLDNMLAIHGRQPFVGPRQVLVGMAEPYSPNHSLAHVTEGEH
jgi:alpha-ketoglutarate-dependent taurine dioxygenase